MADNPPEKKKKPTEFSMEQRLILAFILMGVILFITPYFYPTPEPAPATQTPAATTAEQTPAAETPEPAAAEQEPEQAATAAATPEADTGQRIAATSEKEIVVDTDLYHVVFSNRGAVVKSWQIKGFEDNSGERLDVVNPISVAKVGYPFGIVIKGERPKLHPNDALFVPTVSSDGLEVSFDYVGNGISVTKRFGFAQDSHLVQVTSEMRRNGDLVPHLLAWRGGFGDHTVERPYTLMHSVYYDLAQNKKIEVSKVPGGQQTNSGDYSFAGVEDTYFAAVAMPDTGSPIEVRTYADSVIPPGSEDAQLFVGSAVGGDGVNEFPMYVGPKDLDLLQQIDPRLTSLVNFGFFSIIAKPLFYGLRWIHDHVVGNWGWAIILLTVTINFATLPLKYTSLKSMRKMQTIQPLVKEINERYKGISMRDPRKGQQNEEMMALYKKHGVNPMGGCLPMALQIPFFFAFYTVLRVVIELRGAPWLWVTDLSQPEHLAIRVLPVVMVISQFASQKFTPSSPGIDPNQQKMMMLMPLMFGFFFYGFSAGLVLYWLTNNLVGVGQQLAFNRFVAPPMTDVEVIPADKSKKKKSGKKK